MECIKTVNDKGFIQYENEDGDFVCPRCYCNVLMNVGQGACCDKCKHEDYVESELEYDRI